MHQQTKPSTGAEISSILVMGDRSPSSHGSCQATTRCHGHSQSITAGLLWWFHLGASQQSCPRSNDLS